MLGGFQDPFTKSTDDTRNVAGFQLPVIVEDDQDKPPEFNSIPPVTKISHNYQVGQKILQIQAQDGDRGNPRPLKYTLVNDGTDVSSFFNISEKTGMKIFFIFFIHSPSDDKYYYYYYRFFR